MTRMPNEYSENNTILLFDIAALLFGAYVLQNRGARRINTTWVTAMIGLAIMLTVIFQCQWELVDESYSKDRWMFAHYLEVFTTRHAVPGYSERFTTP